MNEPTLQFFMTPEAKECGLEFKAPRPMDGGFDLPSLEAVTLQPNESYLIRTGIHLAIPEGWVGLLRDRSSVALRGGQVRAGVIDASYRGEVKVLMMNVGAEPIELRSGERCVQLVVVPHLTGSAFEAVSDLDSLGATGRGQGGFGSTGR